MNQGPLPSSEDVYPPEFFRRQDESNDGLFYVEPRLLVHIDEAAICAVGAYLQEALPENAIILDLMSSWRSHLPEGFGKKALVGLGLNEVELAENQQLDERVVHDINQAPTLPFEDDRFDAAIVTVSIQYITRPLEVFREVRRVIKPGAVFHVIYSNRMFPTKAVAVWQKLDDHQRAELIGSYFTNSGGWTPPKATDASPESPVYTDPIFVVHAYKLG
ncbi:MAG: methyltransferase domain-containing protein [Chloroflexi bacterium]|nr:methyltransferase domain-containing protein [Chloroflexota bacterium]MDA1227202.1 methyltransferase domain-containing protein [Chloroflexota bacterium]